MVAGLFYLGGNVKTGEAVFLKTSPQCRGNVSKVEGGKFRVTWHTFLRDVPECLSRDSGVNIREAGKRARVWYSKGDTFNIGFGSPS